MLQTIHIHCLHFMFNFREGFAHMHAIKIASYVIIFVKRIIEHVKPKYNPTLATVNKITPASTSTVAKCRLLQTTQENFVTNTGEKIFLKAAFRRLLK